MPEVPETLRPFETIRVEISASVYGVAADGAEVKLSGGLSTPPVGVLEFPCPAIRVTLDRGPQE